MLAYDYPLLGMFWTFLWFFLWIAWIVVLFRVIFDIFRSKDMGGGAKTLWVLSVIFIPGPGLFVYIIARGSGMQERQLEQAKQMQQSQAEYSQSVAGSSNAADQIGSAKSLLDSGAITLAECDQMKTKALAS